MILKKLKIDGLYGKNYEIDFFDKLTILYGLNGSGKTTILNIIYHIFRGEIKKILEYKFENLSLWFNHNNKDKEFSIFTGSDNQLIICLDDRKYEIKNLEDEISVIWERNDINDDESPNYYISSNHLSDQIKVFSSRDSEVKFEKVSEDLKNISDVVYIPLNRKVKGLDIDDKYWKKGIFRSSSSNKRNIEDSLERAQQYFENYKNQITMSENRINSKIRADMIRNISKPISYKTLNDIHGDFEYLKTSLQQTVGGEIEKDLEKIIETFINSKDSFSIKDGEVIVEDTKKFIEYNFATGQLIKLIEISSIAIKEKEKIDALKRNLDRIIESINTLFEETGKKIYYYNKENKLVFTNIEISGSEKLDLNLLSSGEKQLVIFFIFSLIDFKRKHSKLLLIDEPELSLHIEWQSRLLPLLINRNNNSQIIVATHSPDIMGEFHKNSSEVRGRLS
ncbi:AAA family ATPase [Pseudobacillus badius]|uniref:AAA family ATPase n=1 Tax=Bacillus badius TaxID=1455 RepID=UPI0024A0C2D8|nr:AAA family ATPase [Bacillus badius]GLY10352.1 ATP-binding protein [Bacillus badius]